MGKESTDLDVIYTKGVDKRWKWLTGKEFAKIEVPNRKRVHRNRSD